MASSRSPTCPWQHRLFLVRAKTLLELENTDEEHSHGFAAPLSNACHYIAVSTMDLDRKEGRNDDDDDDSEVEEFVAHRHA